VSDKQVAEEKLRRIVREVEREREGLIPPKGERDAAKQSIESYMRKYVQSRRGLGRDEKYVGDLERKLFRPAVIPIKDHGRDLLTAGDQNVSVSESASVAESREVAENARCRVRTCDLSPRRPLYYKIER
jgi:hypothetical protein